MAQEKDRLSVRESFVPISRKSRRKRVFVARDMKKKNQSLLSALCAWMVEHQIGIAVNLLTLLTLVHWIFPVARQRTRKFFQLSYYDDATGKYGRGWDDMYLVAFYIVIFTGLRVAIMDYILAPLARKGGLTSKKSQTRFVEQAWLLIYDSIFWSLGMYLMYNSDYWLNTKEMFTRFPDKYISGLMKWYYLVQLSFWLQQLVVVNIEDKRKDHWQMFTHHIFTSALVFSSYGHYQVKIGNVILCIMDIVDIFLPLAKILNYLGYRIACDIAFGVFLVVWFLARHVAYLAVCAAIVTQMNVEMPYGCYDTNTGIRVSKDGGNAILANILQPFNDPNGLVCWNKWIHGSFLGMLGALQVLTLIWFGMILRVAYAVVTGKAAADSRSDDEDEDEDGSVSEEEVDFDLDAPLPSDKPPLSVSDAATASAGTSEPVEIEVDGEEMFRSGSPRSARGRAARKSPGARASAISIPGHSDHKELLGRIGCDKPT